MKRKIEFSATVVVISLAGSIIIVLLALGGVFAK